MDITIMFRRRASRSENMSRVFLDIRIPHLDYRCGFVYNLRRSCRVPTSGAWGSRTRCRCTVIREERRWRPTPGRTSLLGKCCWIRSPSLHALCKYLYIFFKSIIIPISWPIQISRLILLLLGKLAGKVAVCRWLNFVSSSPKSRTRISWDMVMSSSVFSTFSALRRLRPQDSIVSLPHWQLAYNPSMIMTFNLIEI